ncbi:MAG: erythromycin esterase family protein [Cyclobacteriaceae bacterium]
MPFRLTVFLLFVVAIQYLPGQQASASMQTIDLENNDNFQGFEQLDLGDQQLFVLAEHWHNIRAVPEATLKILRYLHEYANVRILAIEQGASAAHMINNYLGTGDTTLLPEITQNTMFWGRENRKFFKDLRSFNEALDPEERITVRSIDIEYKMESAIFVINELIEGKEIPEQFKPTLGEFKRLFEQTRAHRESFDGLAVMFYYDKELVTRLVEKTLVDLNENDQAYMSFFKEDFVQFAQLILDMDDGLTFDYTNPNTKYRFRDKIIYEKFEELIEENPDKGILCVIGLRHATKPSSIYKLQNSSSSPIEGRVMNIRLSALFNKSFMTNDLRRINYNYPKQLKNNPATIIKHDSTEPTFKSKEGFDYTIFINRGGYLTRFSKVYEGVY